MILSIKDLEQSIEDGHALRCLDLEGLVVRRLVVSRAVSEDRERDRAAPVLVQYFLASGLYRMILTSE